MTTPPKLPLMLQDSFCMMLAEGALDVIAKFSPKLNEALEELSPDPPDYEPNRYHELCVELANSFKEDYLVAVKPDPDEPSPKEKVTKIR